MVGWLTKRRRRGRSYRSAGRSLERALVSQRSHSQMLVADVRSSSARRKSDSCAAAARRLPQVRLSSWPHTLAFTCAHAPSDPLHPARRWRDYGEIVLRGTRSLAAAGAARARNWRVGQPRGNRARGSGQRVRPVWSRAGVRSEGCSRAAANACSWQQAGTRAGTMAAGTRMWHVVRACDRQLSVMRQRGCRRTSRL